MARVSPVSFDEASPGSHGEWKRQTDTHGRMTNMKRTLARSPEALDAYMTWYTLQDRVHEFLGPRLTLLFSHAISSEVECLVCSTYFRKSLADLGEDPDRLVLDDKERIFVDFGRRLATSPFRVDDKLFATVQDFLNPDQMVTLTAFAGLMVATNIVNNVLEVDLDEYLAGYKADTRPDTKREGSR